LSGLFSYVILYLLRFSITVSEPKASRPTDEGSGVGAIVGSFL